jgi:hypothetical protein
VSRLLAAQGTFVCEPGGRLAVAGLGFEPRALVAWWAGMAHEGVSPGNRGGIGFWAGTPEAVATGWASEDGVSPASTCTGSSRALLLGLGEPPYAFELKGQVESVHEDGFTVGWEIPPRRSWLVQFLALGGPALEAASVGTFERAGGAISLPPPLDRRPDAVLFSPSTPLEELHPHLVAGLGGTDGTRQVSAGYVAFDAAPPGTVVGAQLSDAALVVPGEHDVLRVHVERRRRKARTIAVAWGGPEAPCESATFLALQGLRSRVGTASAPHGSGEKRVGGIGFRPEALVFFTWGLAPSAATKHIGRLCVGAAACDTRQSGAMAWDDRNVEALVSATHAHASGDAVLVVPDTQTGGRHAAASLASVDGDGFTLSWSEADEDERRFAYLALAGRPPARGVRRLLRPR